MTMLRTTAIALAAACVGLGAMPPATADPPGSDSGPVTTDCRARLRGTWPAGDRFNGDIRPLGVRPGGVGFLHHVTGDGTQFHLQAETLLCRRDGGLVPEHGGANIADFTGPGTVRTKTGTVSRIRWEAHVEDRGVGHEREDYFVLHTLDENGDELYFDANFLATGDVVLTPVSPRTNPS